VIGVPPRLSPRSLASEAVAAASPAGFDLPELRLPAPLVLPLVAALLVTVPVFAQAPWVRAAPMAAALFTAPLLALALLLERSGPGLRQELGALLVGFCGSWLGGALFWGWLRLHPLWHLPVEAFALPLAVAGLGGRWRLAGAFYLSSLVGTAATDAVMAATGVMELWPQVLQAPLAEAPQLLQEAGLRVLAPLPLTGVVIGATVLLRFGECLWKKGTIGRVAASCLVTTLIVDGLFLAAALLAPGVSGLV
jgi:hypothetical protein